MHARAELARYLALYRPREAAALVVDRRRRDGLALLALRRVGLRLELLLLLEKFLYRCLHLLGGALELLLLREEELLVLAHLREHGVALVGGGLELLVLLREVGVLVLERRVLLAQLLLRHRQLALLVRQVVDELLVLLRYLAEQVRVRERVLRAARRHEQVELRDAAVLVDVHHALLEYLLRRGDVLVHLFYVGVEREDVFLDLLHLQAHDVDALLRDRYPLAQLVELVRYALFALRRLGQLFLVLGYLLLYFLEFALLLFYLRVDVGLLRRGEGPAAGAEKRAYRERRYCPSDCRHDLHHRPARRARAASRPF